jgi:6,7-dimethyl-8-ribityllumazine synthase
MTTPVHILVVEGRFYDHISDELLRGAELALKEREAGFEIVTVPGALEVPQVLAAAIASGLFSKGAAKPFHGCVALGCVIRGETSHNDIVANESARALLSLSTAHNIPLGNGILTVENEAQALKRAAVNGKNKGRHAVEACIEVIHIKHAFEQRVRAAS